jgi:diguanylate cyclase (GGDEF)-like protein/PAS domain S-box-containing protein
VRVSHVPADRGLVARQLPLIAVMLLLGPVLMASLRLAGAGYVLTTLVGTVGFSVALVWLLGVVRRDHRELTGQLESRDSQLVTILDGLPIAVMLRAADGSLLHINPGGVRFVERLGVGVSHVSESPSSLLDYVEVIDEDGRPYDPARLPVVSALRDSASREATLGYALPGGGYAWYAVRAAPVQLSDGTTGTVVTCDDVTERHDASHLVQVAELSLRRTFDHAPIGIAVLAMDGQLLQANAALCDLLGYDETHLVAEGLEGVASPDDEHDDWQQLAARLSATDERYLVDRRFRHASGRWVFTQLSVAVVRSADGTPLHLIAQVVDLSERRAVEEELRAAAVEDPLTGLANRRALAQRLTEAQARRGAGGGGEIGLLYVDLDHFKSVNDTYGHDVGDRVLIEAGRRLLVATRDADTVCRMGGDEFVVLCAPIDGIRGLRDLVDRLAILPPLTVLVQGVPVSVAESVGAIMVRPDEDLDRALRRADAAMYRAKRGARISPQLLGRGP